MTQPAAQQPGNPAPIQPPSTSATLGERMALKRNAILAKSPPPSNDAEGDTGGATTEPGGIAPAKTEAPANDAAAPPETAANDNQEAPKVDPEKAEAERREAAKLVREQRRKVVHEAVSLRTEKRKLRQIEKQQAEREARIKATEAEHRELAELRQKDPIAAARKLGLSMREFAERELRDEQAKPKVPLEDLPPEVRAEIEESRKFREEQARKEKEREERETAAEREQRVARATTEGQRHIASVFAAEKGDYPHLETFFEPETVIASAWQIIYSHFEETEEELDLRKVLGYMEDNARKEREKFSKPLPPKGVPDRASREASQASNPEPTTMSQSDAASGAPVVRKETQAQKRERIRKRSQSR